MSEHLSAESDPRPDSSLDTRTSRINPEHEADLDSEIAPERSVARLQKIVDQLAFAVLIIRDTGAVAIANTMAQQVFLCHAAQNPATSATSATPHINLAGIPLGQLLHLDGCPFPSLPMPAAQLPTTHRGEEFPAANPMLSAAKEALHSLHKGITDHVAFLLHPQDRCGFRHITANGPPGTLLHFAATIDHLTTAHDRFAILHLLHIPLGPVSRKPLRFISPAAHPSISHKQINSTHDTAQNPKQIPLTPSAILDTTGTVVEANKAWHDTSTKNTHDDRTATCAKGHNYLEICDSLSRDLRLPHSQGKKGKSSLIRAESLPASAWTSARAAIGIRAVLSPEIPDASFTLEYVDTDPCEERWFEFSAVALPGREKHCAISHHDVSSRQRAQRQLHENAEHDLATGLHNRASLLSCLPLCLARAHQADNILALFSIGFTYRGKNSNTPEWQTDEQILRNLAQQLAATRRSNDLLARTGDMQFALIFENMRGKSQVGRLAKRLATALSAPVSTEEGEFHLQPCIGISLSSPHATRPLDLLLDAEEAMRASQRAGVSWQIGAPWRPARTSRRAKAVQDLRSALSEQQFDLHYQVIHALPSCAPRAIEVLTRKHKNGNTLNATNFIQDAEEAGLITSIDEWVLESVCKQLEEWSKWSGHAISTLPIHINVSSHSLASRSFPQRLSTLLDTYNLQGERLTIEIRDDNIFSCDQTITALTSLAQRGVRICIDGFGAGNMPVSELLRFPISALKIDRTLLPNTKDDKKQLTLWRSIINFAHNLGIEALAGKIETRHQFDIAQATGCDACQGYALSMPKDAKSLFTSTEW